MIKKKTSLAKKIGVVALSAIILASGIFPIIAGAQTSELSDTSVGSNVLALEDTTTKYNSILPSYTTMYSQATVSTSKGDQYTVTTSTWKKFQ